jgi:hypothetical protein
VVEAADSSPAQRRFESGSGYVKQQPDVTLDEISHLNFRPSCEMESCQSQAEWVAYYVSDCEHSDPTFLCRNHYLEQWDMYHNTNFLLEEIVCGECNDMGVYTPVEDVWFEPLTK